MPEYVIPPSFKKRLRRKTPQLQAAIVECIQRLGENPRHPGLRAHRMHGMEGVWEAYVDRGNRVTFEYAVDGSIVLRNHCNHDILKRSA